MVDLKYSAGICLQGLRKTTRDLTLTIVGALPSCETIFTVGKVIFGGYVRGRALLGRKRYGEKGCPFAHREGMWVE
jgi:hypothetical protein